MIALDGTSGVGKSTTAKRLAEVLNLYFLSTGRIYRAMGWLALKKGWDIETPPLSDWFEGFDIHVRGGGDIVVNGETPDMDLGSELISRTASVISTVPFVRDMSNRIQRQIVENIRNEKSFDGVILEGRDIATVVFPDATHKFFITASPMVRARRRYEELRQKDPSVTLEAIAQGIEERDQRDQTRDIAPLKPADDAVMVDTSEMGLEAVVEKILMEVKGRAASG